MMEKEKQIETVPVSTRITRPMHKAVLKLLETNAHLNMADYVRDLIRKDLDTKGVLPREAEKHE
jgi:Arc/MetJ-type ribon-helix-helix transcriptional regulator